MQDVQIQKVKIDTIFENHTNPRFINEKKFKKLLKSVREFPEMLKLRPIVVNKEMGILGGNMRFKACKELGLKDVYIIKVEDLNDSQIEQFIIKDNVGYGEWDWDILANNWEMDKLEDWGLDLPLMNNDEDEYTNKIKAPVYEPENDKPDIDTIITNTKVNKLLEEIKNSTLDKEQKEFLKICAYRHYVFDYTKVADLYANSENEMQDLMEKSALIIIDFDKAIENGFVEMSDQIAKTYG
tara:strand:+ start:812 stop:1531 length:720 start_codon:yes stop_codon:yes gene_type:complete